MSMTAAQRRAGWLTTLIQRARTNGVDNREIAAALESAIVFHPLTIARDDRGRLIGRKTDAEVTLHELFSLPDEDLRTR